MLALLELPDCILGLEEVTTSGTNCPLETGSVHWEFLGEQPPLPFLQNQGVSCAHEVPSSRPHRLFDAVATILMIVIRKNGPVPPTGPHTQD